MSCFNSRICHGWQNPCSFIHWKWSKRALARFDSPCGFIVAPIRDSVLYHNSPYSTEEFPLCYGKYASDCDDSPRCADALPSSLASKYCDDFPESGVTEPFCEQHASSEFRWYSLLDRVGVEEVFHPLAQYPCSLVQLSTVGDIAVPLSSFAFISRRLLHLWR